jgi:hypothetical protein
MNENNKSFANFELSHPSNTHLKFETCAVDHFYFEDRNNNIYTSNKIVFNSKSGTAQSAQKAFLLSEAYLMMPIQFSLTLTGGTFIDSPYLKNSVCLKGYHHLIDSITASSIGDVNDLVNSGSYFRNVYMNEKLKERALQDTYLKSSLHRCVLDNHESFTVDISDCVGEINNSTSGKTFAKNNAFAERNKHFVYYGNRNIVPGAKGTVETLMMDQTKLNTAFIPYCEYVSNTVLNFYDVVKIPLATISDFYKNLNYPINNISNFKLELGLNMGETTITYKDLRTGVANAYASDDYTVDTVQYSPFSGRTNPFMISSASAGLVDAAGEKLSDLTMLQTTPGTGVVAKITSKIGWTNGIACRIYVPEVFLESETASSIYQMNNGDRSIMYKDYFIDDSQRGLACGANVNWTINTSANRATTLYIIPFLSNQSAYGGSPGIAFGSANGPSKLMLPPQLSPLSSCPNTCAYLKIENLQIRNGQSNLFFCDMPKYEHQFYDNLQYHNMGGFGNATNSIFQSGLITQEMYSKCYGVIKLDLATQEMQQAFDTASQPNINFKIVSGDPTYKHIKYDFLLIMEFVKQVNMNIMTCLTAKA